MSKVVNEPRIKNGFIKAIRDLMEHRALWMYLLCDEAKKKGLAPESYAPAAIFRCGCYQGKLLVDKGQSQSLRSLKKLLFHKFARMIFEMKIIRSTDDNFDLDFYYCPLVTAWQKQGCSDEEMEKLCDFAMSGDRGIAESFGCKLDLLKTIAKGDRVCQLRFRRSS